MNAWRSRSRWLRVAGLIVLLVGGGYAVRWWIERPLAAARQAYAKRDWWRAAALARSVAVTGRCETEARLLVGSSLCQLGEWNEATVTLRQVPLPQIGTETLELWGQGLVGQRWWSPAIEVLEELLKRRPRDSAFLQQLAVVHFQVGNTTRAMELATQLATHSSHSAAAYCIQGAIHEAVDHTESAVECYESCMRLMQEGQNLPIPRAQILEKLVRNLKSLGRFADAKKYLSDELDREPTAALRTELGEVLWAQGESAAAREEWFAALRHDKRYALAMAQLGKLALEENLPAEAVGWLRLAKEQGTTSASMEYMLSRAYRRLGHTTLADYHNDEYRRLMEAGYETQDRERNVMAARGTPHGLWLMAQQAVRIGDWSEAEGHLIELQRLFPNDSEVDTLLADVRRRARDAPSAASP